jgi:hypothetical protein
MGDSDYIDKALRIREMETDGYFASVNGEDDTHSEYLMPTEKFYLHADQVRRIFVKDFLMIEK